MFKKYYLYRIKFFADTRGYAAQLFAESKQIRFHLRFEFVNICEKFVNI